MGSGFSSSVIKVSMLSRLFKLKDDDRLFDEAIDIEYEKPEYGAKIQVSKKRRNISLGIFFDTIKLTFGCVLC